MKNSIIFLTFFLFCMVGGFTASAQGNLQFSKAIFISQDTTVTGNGADVAIVKTISVPQGKVLKIESASTLSGHMYLEKATIFNTSGNNMPAFPIWLPEGEYNIGVGFANSTVTTSWWISAIEFSIVP